MPDRNTPPQTHPDLSSSLLSPTSQKGLSLCQHHLIHGTSQPIVIVHGVDAVLPGLHTHDEATHKGSLSSWEGSPTYKISPPVGGVRHSGQLGCMLRHARPNTALHGSSRTRSHWMPLDITVDGKNTPPLAPTEGGSSPGTCCYATQNCNKNSKIYENLYPHPEPPALPTCPSVFFALNGPRGKKT